MSPPSDHASPSSSLSLEAFCAREVASFEAQGLKRWMRPVVGPQGPRLSLEGKSYENFSSNDYLGLAAHPTIQQRARETWTLTEPGRALRHLSAVAWSP